MESDEEEEEEELMEEVVVMMVESGRRAEKNIQFIFCSFKLNKIFFMDEFLYCLSIIEFDNKFVVLGVIFYRLFGVPYFK